MEFQKELGKRVLTRLEQRRCDEERRDGSKCRKTGAAVGLRSSAMLGSERIKAHHFSTILKEKDKKEKSVICRDGK